jgi:hypothetical protein
LVCHSVHLESHLCEGFVAVDNWRLVTVKRPELRKQGTNSQGLA